MAAQLGGIDACREQMLAAGIDPAFAEVAVNGSRRIAQGGNARLTDEVQAGPPAPHLPRLGARPPGCLRQLTNSLSGTRERWHTQAWWRN